MSKYEKQVESHQKTADLLQVRVQNAEAHLREQERAHDEAQQVLAESKRKLAECNSEMAQCKAAAAAAGTTRSDSPKPTGDQIFTLTSEELQQA
eukprot:3992804-Pyramimonas_sp.AAC.1